MNQRGMQSRSGKEKVMEHSGSDIRDISTRQDRKRFQSCKGSRRCFHPFFYYSLTFTTLRKSPPMSFLKSVGVWIKPVMYFNWKTSPSSAAKTFDLVMVALRFLRMPLSHDVSLNALHTYLCVSVHAI